ncbi:GspE/PulE family protein [Candidatus Reidiella endopervernicosa]|uniref:Type II/IV secretion system protein n=1 Tax=Candidatus Reidiella endopervernicosa TaxID=2738883 RepID=A0A6N0HW74_9GAMM|nr:GspE/PulE family protein [Candidatus Reidiella endopervernicosa]QKQ26625.1 type II/IV secretion system protein [Candidatus Reidiella endopervernicosa]
MLGFGEHEVDTLRDLITKPHGMVLVTGPTGSGKSTTLYSLLNEVKRQNPHIITVEDPVEYAMDGVEQIQISNVKGYTFAEALRHILRHDPDVIMVGEIRDLETAQIANKAALTGHLMLSTLHTNDAISSVTRLIDMGVEPFLLSSTLLGAMAQRLVRVICEECKEVDTIDTKLRQTLGVSDDEIFYRGRGCPTCSQSGYRGRVAVCEIFTVTPEIQQLIHANKGEQAIREALHKAGMTTLFEDALELAREGRTTLEEAYKVRTVG